MVRWRQYAGSWLAGLEITARPGGPWRVLTDEAACVTVMVTVLLSMPHQLSRATPALVGYPWAAPHAR